MKTSINSRNVELTALAALANGGLMKIYTSPQPSTPETAITTQTLLSTVTMGTPAFGTASNGIITANAISQDNNIAQTGTAAWFRLYKSDGTTVISDGTVGLVSSGSDLEMNSVSLLQGAIFQVGSLTWTLPQ